MLSKLPVKAADTREKRKLSKHAFFDPSDAAVGGSIE
jgi:hypothetical protein